jgi:hypothetical protein
VTPSDKKDLFYQLTYLVLKTRELVNMLKSSGVSLSEESPLSLLLKEIDYFSDKYYMNFDMCDECGCPVPSVPNLKDKARMMATINKYLNLYELKTGEDVEDYLIKKVEVKQEIIEVEEPELPQAPKLKLSPKLAEFGNKNKAQIIRGQLLDVRS